MRNFAFSVLALALVATSGAAVAAGESGKVVSTTTKTIVNSAVLQGAVQGNNWGGALGAPGGLAAYREPFRGFTLPPYWMQPGFFIEDYARYGFAAPQDGFGWSRYYDDAVLTDSGGRVVDFVKGTDWARLDNGQFGNGAGAQFGQADFDRGRDRGLDRGLDRGRDRDGGLGGALIGGAAGALAGNLIGGRGDRLVGSLIGGGVGALAGLAIDRADGAGRGEFGRGRIDKLSRKERHRLKRERRYGRGYGRHRGPHWGGGDYYRDDDWYDDGYGRTITTVEYVPVAPITTTTTTTRVITENVYGTTKMRVPYHRPAKTYRRPRQCTCGS